MPLPFSDQKPQAPLDPHRMEPILLGTISQSLDSGRSLPSIRVWLVSGVVASLTILALALHFPLQQREEPRPSGDIPLNPNPCPRWLVIPGPLQFSPNLLQIPLCVRRLSPFNTPP